jgi:hypothetical protein
MKREADECFVAADAKETPENPKANSTGHSMKFMIQCLILWNFKDDLNPALFPQSGESVWRIQRLRIRHS